MSDIRSQSEQAQPPTSYSPPTPDSQEAALSPQTPQWLTLSEASDVLGVHYTTLRTWADNGDIPVFRTPGGHRRFSAADLRRFLAERSPLTALTDSTALVDAAVGRVREQIQQQQMMWLHTGDEQTRDLRRQRGRQLFGLAMSFIMKPQQRERILEDGRMLGWEYGREAAFGGITLSATGRAVQFFRNQLSDVVRDSSEGLDAEDVRIRRLLNQFLDEVLYSVLDGYEQALISLEDR